MATSSVPSLDALKAKLKERQQIDLSAAPRFFHQGIGATFLIVPMSDEGYSDIERIDVPDKRIEHWPTGDVQKLYENQRTHRYLLHGCRLEDGTRLDHDAINEIQKGPWGAQNRALISEIRKVNPPRDVLVQEFQATIAATRLTLTLFRILKEAKALNALRDWLLIDESDEKAQVLAEDLRKWEDALLPFEALMEADKAAQVFDIGVYERLKAEEAAKAQKAQQAASGDVSLI